MVTVDRRVFPLGFLNRMLGLMLLYTLARFFFYQFNRTSLSVHSSHEIFQAFLLGVRFDAWVVAATLLPAFLLEVAIWGWRMRSPYIVRLASAYSGFVLVLHSVFLFFEMSDCEYFRFSGRRTTLGILKLSGDATQQSLQLLLNFWHVPFIWGLMCIALVALWRKTHPRVGQAHMQEGVRKHSGRRIAAVIVAGILMGVLALRGGFQRKPIAPAHAMELGNSQMAALALSTAFQLTHSAENQTLQPIDFFATESEAEKLLALPGGRFAPVSLQGYNVIVLVVESLSQEYMGYRGLNTNFVPFVTELANKSVYFDNAYANGRQSIDALPSIMAALPSLIGDPFITSQYSSVGLASLGHTLAQKGYSTAFFHGGKNGSMYIDAMAKLFGFSQYFGLSEYPHADRDFDGSWGIFDEPFLAFTAEKISQLPQPFAAGIFTLSSHNPYHVPEHLKEKLPAGRRLFHRSLAYADHSLRMFFQAIQNQPWFNKTIFVLTGDHTAEGEVDSFMKEQSIYRVPILFYDPSGRLKPQRSQRLVQHADVFPSLVDLLALDLTSTLAKPLPLGQSVFAPSQYARAANRSGDWFWYQEGQSVVRTLRNGSGPIEIVDLQENTLVGGAARVPTAEEEATLVARAKAYLQLYTNSLLSNQFTR